MSFYDEDDYDVDERTKELLEEKKEDRLRKARFKILQLQIPISYNTPTVQSIYEQALKSRLIKVPRDSDSKSADARRDWYVVLMGRVSYKFLVGKSFRQLYGTTVNTSEAKIKQTNADEWSRTYTIHLIENGLQDITSIKTSTFCQIFQRNVMPSADIGVPIGCECKDWQYRFVNTAEGKESLHNFATAGCKHMLAVEEAIREYPKIIDQNSQ